MASRERQAPRNPLLDADRPQELSGRASWTARLPPAQVHNSIGNERLVQGWPGFISTQLHRAIGDSRAFLNYAIWESVDLFRQAFTHPDFQSHIADYPPSAVISPHLFQRMTVANLCVA